jgi:sister-chromatid-cohesion protein PDS5
LLLGILTAYMTYQAGLAPPGSTWTDNENGYRAGDSILASISAARYQAFFYCNTTSFMASVILIILLLQRTVSPRGMPLRAMQAAMALDLAGLLGAYAVGTYWMRKQAFAYVTVLLAAVVVYVMLHVLPWRGNTVDPAASTSPASSHQPAGNAIEA